MGLEQRAICQMHTWSSNWPGLEEMFLDKAACHKVVTCAAVHQYVGMTASNLAADLEGL